MKANFFQNKVILITGASSGIGRELANSFASLGSKLILISRNLERLEELRQEILQKEKTEILIISGDLEKKEFSKQILDKSVDKFKRIDFLILNAGISMNCPFREVEKLSDMEKIMQINYFANVYLIHYFLEQIKKDKTTIVAISSVQGIIGIPYHSGYVASKHALNGFLDSLQLEEKDIFIQKILLSWVRGTNLRKNSIFAKNASEEVKNKKSKKNMFSINLDECVAEIVKAMISQKKNIYLPKLFKHLYFMKTFFNSLLNKIILKVVGKEFKK